MNEMNEYLGNENENRDHNGWNIFIIIVAQAFLYPSFALVQGNDGVYIFHFKLYFIFYFYVVVVAAAKYHFFCFRFILCSVI